MTDLTIILTYYNQNKILEKQIQNWESYSDEILQKITFIIIDDGSLIPAKVNTSKLNINIFRILEDIPWNIGGARNLGFSVATGKWILQIDMDLLVSEDSIIKILKLIQNANPLAVYKFRRFNPLTKKDKIHPGTMLITKDLYWKVGGCDEDFVGSYGYTDIHFLRQRLPKIKGTSIEKIYDITLIEDLNGEIKTLNRDTVRNEKLYHQKIKNDNWSNKCLRFKWKQIL